MNLNKSLKITNFLNLVRLGFEPQTPSTHWPLSTGMSVVYEPPAVQRHTLRGLRSVDYDIM